MGPDHPAGIHLARHNLFPHNKIHSGSRLYPEYCIISTMSALGIDIGGSSVKLAAVNSTKTLWQQQSERYTQPTRSQLAHAIRKAAAGRSERDAAVGICVPGRRDQGGRSVLLSVNIPTLNGLTLVELFTDAI